MDLKLHCIIIIYSAVALGKEATVSCSGVEAIFPVEPIVMFVIYEDV